MNQTFSQKGTKAFIKLLTELFNDDYARWQPPSAEPVLSLVRDGDLKLDDTPVEMPKEIA